MIDKLRITGISGWPAKAVIELCEQLQNGTPDGVDTILPKNGYSRITLELPESWPALKRERLRNDVQKTLSKAEHDHGLEATLESIEETDAEERDATFS